MLKKVGSYPLPIPPAALPKVFDVFKEVINFLETKEREATKREQIRAFKEFLTEVIRFYEINFECLFNIQKHQREKTFETLFEELDKTLGKENPELVAAVGRLIIELHKTPIITKEEAKALLQDAIEKSLRTGTSFEDINDDGENDNILPVKIILQS
jgi:hypothetical protein